MRFTTCMFVLIGALLISACLMLLDTACADEPKGEIAFVRGNFGHANRRKIWIINADGSGLRPLTDNEFEPGEDRPAWSPDGKRIAYCAIRNYQRRIYCRDADGQNEICLTPEPGSDEFENPEWSPDGKSIACCMWPAGRKTS